MVLHKLCILVLWRKVALALEGLSITEMLIFFAVFDLYLTAVAMTTTENSHDTLELTPTIYVVSMTTYVTMHAEAVPCLNITKSILKAVIFPAMSLLSLSVLSMNIVSVTHKQINMARSDNFLEI